MPIVVAQRGDIHGQAVIQALKALGVQPRCVDHVGIALRYFRRIPDASIPTSEARGWIRSLPQTFPNQLEAESLAWQALLEGTASDPCIDWLSPLPMIRQADNKLYQLLLAEHLGILIPKTAVPCDVVAITELVGRNPVVVKPLGKGVAIGADGARRVFYTTAIETDDLAPVPEPIW
jgi:hypothetical protein